MPIELRCRSSKVNIPLAVTSSSSIKSMNKFIGASSSHPGMNTSAYKINVDFFAEGSGFVSNQ
jgi:hypothetical protein